jgi:tRNA threonylcarbamoyladenosine biosynthesis protein TsaE
MKITAKSLTETEIAAKDFVSTLNPQATALVVGLYGDLGSGKTTFTQAVARTLGIAEVVTSPTFIIEKIYKLHDQHFDHLIHIDAYRLESGKELENLGFDEIATDPKNLIMIEWPEKVAEILPPDIVKLKFTFINESTREIEYGQ